MDVPKYIYMYLYSSWEVTLYERVRVQVSSHYQVDDSCCFRYSVALVGIGSYWYLAGKPHITPSGFVV